MANTRWVWIPDGEARVLAFTYVDRVAGPSAKGRIVVGDPPPQEQILEAIDHPNRTFRRPDAFGASPIGAEEALRLGLPKDPPWIGHFEGKPIPPPRGKPSRTVGALVHRRGVPVAGVRVRIGHVFGPSRELAKLDERTTDAAGRCEFPLAPCEPIAAIASGAREGSQLVDVPDSGTVELALEPLGTLDGVVTRSGAPARGQITLVGIEGGTLAVERTDDAGRYRVEGVVPGRYEVRVLGIDPETSMVAGTPTFDELVVGPGQRLRRDYALTAGTAIRVVAAVQDQEHWGDVYLFAGARAPRDSIELRALWRGLDKTLWRSANSTTNDGKHMRCKFLDVAPGVYTVCVTPSTRYGGAHDEQPVVSREITVGTEDVTVELVVPALRPA
ncbi:MAG TPA: hypothetical protein VNO30_48835 [Kofleriaceae bacterium]|nr:hypothetical protein [Kofleriaceae bacterium]